LVVAENGWTIETLKEHFDVQLRDLELRQQQRFEAQTKAIDAALAAADRAVQNAMTASEEAIIKAEVAIERRFEGVNEFRQTLSDQAHEFMTRAEGMTIIDRNTKDIQEVKDRLNTMQGRGSGLDAGWAKLVGVVGLISTLLAIGLVLSRIG